MPAELVMNVVGGERVVLKVSHVRRVRTQASPVYTPEKWMGENLCRK